MAKERVRVYNKGKRDWILAKGVNCDPGRSVEVDKDVAEKFLAAYPQEFVLGDSVASTGRGSEKAMKAKIAELEKENAELKAKIADKPKKEKDTGSKE